MAQPIRIGIGFDVHRLAEGRRLMLAGIHVLHTMGPEAHSDGDVVLHAVADALLGAAGLGDLGDHFPDTDPAWKGAASSALLGRVLDRVRRAGWTPTSADVNILLDRPRLTDFKGRMRERLAELLGLAADAVGLKARTLEGLGPIGEGRAVAAQAVVVLGPASPGQSPATPGRSPAVRKKPRKRA